MSLFKKRLFMGLMFTVIFLLSACRIPNTQSAAATGNAVITESPVTAGITAEVSVITEDVQSEAENGSELESETIAGEGGAMTMNVQIGSSTFTATLEDNPAVDSFVRMMENAPVVIKMSDYSGFEKVGAIGTSLPASNSQTTAQSGDIVLYNGNQIVIFYGSNSWSYTRLGKIDDLSGWEEALGSGDVTVTFSMKQTEWETKQTGRKRSRQTLHNVLQGLSVFS
ncbi:cyclophilin-like fold protein [Clostridium sp. chh4-2]|uniref:cyclophilin-like fold protein n=1 Tax=Clostridium sp. chh4-2 TaxID=2067550 RepID=UPI0015E17906|nr:cyclophilin-like fold protein [Clostridium sp. chh4-2]